MVDIAEHLSSLVLLTTLNLFPLSWQVYLHTLEIWVTCLVLIQTPRNPAATLFLFMLLYRLHAHRPVRGGGKKKQTGSNHANLFAHCTHIISGYCPQHVKSTVGSDTRGGHARLTFEGRRRTALPARYAKSKAGELEGHATKMVGSVRH